LAKSKVPAARIKVAAAPMKDLLDDVVRMIVFSQFVFCRVLLVLPATTQAGTA